MDIIANANTQPSMAQIQNHIMGDAGTRWRRLTSHLEQNVKSKPQITYSTCAGKPGWNVKYKKSGRALCTLYPESESFMALVVLGERDHEAFNASAPVYTEYTRDMYETCKPLGSAKWLMISVVSDEILDDILKLIHLKMQKP